MKMLDLSDTIDQLAKASAAGMDMYWEGIRTTL